MNDDRSTVDQAAWARALTAAREGDPVRVAIALRPVSPAPPPASILTAVAPIWARLTLDSADTSPWRALALAVHERLSPVRPVHELHLAWELLASATDLTGPTSPERARCLLLLGAVAWRLGHPAQATPLLRTAQELSRQHRLPEVFGGAALVLAAQARAEGDPTLADGIVRHAARLLRDELRADPSAFERAARAGLTAT